MGHNKLLEQMTYGGIFRGGPSQQKGRLRYISIKQMGSKYTLILFNLAVNQVAAVLITWFEHLLIQAP